MPGIIDTLRLSNEWKFQHLWSIAPRVKEINRPELPPLSVFLDEGVVPRDSRVDNHNQLGEDLSKYLVVRPGDIVFNRLRAWQGGLGVSLYAGIVSPAYFVCRPVSSLVDSRYLHYLLRSAPYIAELARISKWMPPSQFDIPWECLRVLPVLIPPLEDQRRIARFLDIETGRIRDLVEKKRRMVALMNERIDSEILKIVGQSRLVCPNSGTPIQAIRRSLTKVYRPAMSNMGVITAYRDGQVTDRSLRRADGYTLSASAEPHGQYVEENDVVIHGLDGFAGAIGTSEARGNCSPVYHVCTPVNNEDPRFLGRLLRLLAIQGYLGNFAISTRERAVDFRNWDLFGRIPIPAAPLCEQYRIGDTITSIRPLCESIGKSESLAAERREALITAAVTGEFDVSSASGRGVTELVR
jgi:type I restriction enzyme S subunit